jgi:predicted nucleic acid-binding protein
MRRILIDTNIYVALKRNVKNVVEILRRVDYIGINSVVLGELYSGFKGGDKEAINLQELEHFLDTPRVEVIPIDEVTSEFYAQIYWSLKRKGLPIPTNDMWIAASAFQHSLALFSLDAHFKKINGLMIK